MKLTAVFIPVEEGGYTAFIEEIPGVITQGETMEEARENLCDALKMILECNREIVRKSVLAGAVRDNFEISSL